jgi:hypothetical protein
MSDDNVSRIDSEWVALNAFRELLKLATKGDMSKSTYDDALEFGGQLYPALLGQEVSLLRRARESDTTKEYRQRARLLSQKRGTAVDPLDLLTPRLRSARICWRLHNGSKIGTGWIN